MKKRIKFILIISIVIRVAVLIALPKLSSSGDQEAGYYSVEWNSKNNFGNPVSSGMYLYQIKAGDFVKVHKMILLR